jgi:hypothetical protein
MQRLQNVLVAPNIFHQLEEPFMMAVPIQRLRNLNQVECTSSISPQHTRAFHPCSSPVVSNILHPRIVYDGRALAYSPCFRDKMLVWGSKRVKIH